MWTFDQIPLRARTLAVDERDLIPLHSHPNSVRRGEPTHGASGLPKNNSRESHGLRAGQDAGLFRLGSTSFPEIPASFPSNRVVLRIAERIPPHGLESRRSRGS